MAELIAKTTKVHGKTVRYYRTRSNGKEPILILHGFMSDATGLKKFADSLRTDRPIIIPDLPGFGESECPDKNDGLKSYVGWLDDFLKHIDAAPSTIIGYSFGAYIAVMYTALFNKSKNAKLILITPVVKINWQVRLYGRGFRLMALKNARFAERLWLLQHDMTTRYLWRNRHPSSRNDLMARRREELVYLQPELVLRLFSEFLELNFLTYAKKLKTPTVIVTAANDNVAVASATRSFAEMIKAPVLVMKLAHAGHLLPIEEPTILAAALKGHISSGDNEGV